MAALSNALRSDACDAVTGQLNGGTLKIYTGAPPANPNVGPTGTLLVTLTFQNPAFNAAVNGSASANPIISGTAVATGTAGYARVTGPGGDADLSVGVTGTGEVQLPSLAITTGQVVSASSGIWEQPQ